MPMGEEQTKPLILIVEDEPEDLQVLCTILRRKEEYRIAMAGNGHQALEMVDNISPDLIMLDVKMPGIDGFEVCKRLKAKPVTREIPIIFLTCKKEDEDKVEGFFAGAVDYVTKPFNVTELLARVRTHIQLKASKDGILRINRELQAARQNLEKELIEAGNYLKAILPHPLPQNPRMDWRYKPSPQLGGSLFGYHWLDDEHFAFYMLKVSGTGIGAALMSVAIVRFLESRETRNTELCNPAAVLDRLNHENQNKRPYSIWYGIYKRSAHRLIYSGAGHPPALLMTGPHPNTAHIEKLKTPEIAIGEAPDITFENNEISLGTHARLFVFNKGVYENGNIPGEETWNPRTWDSLLDKYGRDPVLNLDNLIQPVREMAGPHESPHDFALLAIDFQKR